MINMQLLKDNKRYFDRIEDLREKVGKIDFQAKLVQDFDFFKKYGVNLHNQTRDKISYDAPTDIKLNNIFKYVENTIAIIQDKDNEIENRDNKIEKHIQENLRLQKILEENGLAEKILKINISTTTGNIERSVTNNLTVDFEDGMVKFLDDDLELIITEEKFIDYEIKTIGYKY